MVKLIAGGLVGSRGWIWAVGGAALTASMQEWLRALPGAACRAER